MPRQTKNIKKHYEKWKCPSLTTKHDHNLFTFFLVDCKARIDLEVRDDQKNTSSKNRTKRPLSLLFRELWPIY